MHSTNTAAHTKRRHADAVASAAVILPPTGQWLLGGEARAAAARSASHSLVSLALQLLSNLPLLTVCFLCALCVCCSSSLLSHSQ